MSNLESYHSIAKNAPGSYIHALSMHAHSSLAEREQAKKIIAQLSRLDLSPKIGEAWCPTIRSTNTQEPFGVLVRVNTQQKGIPLPTKEQNHIRNWLSRLLDDIPVEIPQLYIDNLPPNWNIRGLSWGLAGIIAIISALLQTKPSEPVICSGILSKDRGIVRSVRGPKAKRSICLWEAPDIEPVIVQRASPIVLYIKALFGTHWKPKIFSLLRLTPRALAEEALNQYEQHNKDCAQRMANNVLNMKESSDISDILAHFVLGSVEKHKGQSNASIKNLTIARQKILICEEMDQLDFYLRFRLEANLGIAMMHNLQITKGISIVEQGLRDLSSIQAYHRDVRWRSVSLRMAGTLRWLYISNGELSKAEDISFAWPLSKAKVPEHLCRALYSLADIYWRRGEFQKAKSQYREAKKYFADVRPVERSITQRYLTLCGTRLGEEPIKKHQQRWSEHLIEQLEILESALHYHRLPELFTDHVSPLPNDFSTLFILSGFVARHIVQYGPEPQFAPFFQQLIQYQAQMPTNMSKAFAQLIQGNAKQWAQIAPY